MRFRSCAVGVFCLILTASLLSIFPTGVPMADDLHGWSENDKAILRTLWIGSLPPVSEDPSNAFSDNPMAASLGKKLFFDTRFSGNEKVSCATCHRPDTNFTDNLPLAHGMGTASRRSMTLIGVAYNSWFFWDGRKDSLWAQALEPIESPVEHGFTRTMCALVISEHYRREYEEVFGPIPDIAGKTLPGIARPAADDPGALKAWVVMSHDERRVVNRIYVNMGKAIGAYVRTILPGPSPFDAYVDALMKGNREGMEKALKPDEVRGLRLFSGKAGCTNCHNGPMLTDGDFHNIGVPGRKNLAAERGRAEGIAMVLSDEFNCLSEHSDADAGECRALRFSDTAADRYFGAFKTPTLRNVAGRSPYMHAGQFATLGEVLEFYRKAQTPEIMHGGLTDAELKQLEAFLLTLSGPVQSL